MAIKPLTTRDRQNRHDLNGFAGKDRKVRMVLEHPCRGFVRFGANDGKGAHLVADVGNAARADPLGLAKRSAHRGERGLVLLHPRLRSGNALFLLRLSLRLGQRKAKEKEGIAAWKAW